MNQTESFSRRRTGECEGRAGARGPESPCDRHRTIGRRNSLQTSSAWSEIAGTRVSTDTSGTQADYADRGGRDIAKLYDSTLDDLWEAEYRQGETWSKMTSATRALYEAMAFEQVKGYCVNGGTNTLRKRIVPPELDFVLTHGDWEDGS